MGGNSFVIYGLYESLLSSLLAETLEIAVACCLRFFEAEEAESHRWRSRQGIQSTREWLGCQ